MGRNKRTNPNRTTGPNKRTNSNQSAGPNKKTSSNQSTGPNKRTSSNRSTKPKQWALPPFFEKDPQDWGIHSYLKYGHGDLPDDQVLDEYRKSLEFIIGRGDEETELRRRRALELLDRYTQKGEGSDRFVGRQWLKRQPEERSLNIIGTVIHGDVNDSVINQFGSQGDRLENSHTPGGGDRATVQEESDDEIPTPEQSHEGLHLASWRRTYKEMHDENKWVLTSGRSVEHVIYQACNAMDPSTFASSPARSFILDISDPVTKSWFTKDEWNEIMASVLPLPNVDQRLWDAFKGFHSVQSTTMLREVLKSGWIPDGVTYDANLQWADLAIRKFLMLLEAPDEPLTRSHLEGWYRVQIWSCILDTCLLDLKGLTVERTEATCKATAQRRNRHRQDVTTRQKLGPRLDGIFSTLGDDSHEYGGIEDGPTFTGGLTATKWLDDTIKLIKCLRDMLFRLHELVNHDPKITRQVQVVGIFTAGLALQCVRLGYPGVGYVSLLKREKLIHVPTTVKNLPELLTMLLMVARWKEVIRESLQAVQDRHCARSQDSFYEWLAGGNATSGARLGWSGDTP